MRARIALALFLVGTIPMFHGCQEPAVTKTDSKSSKAPAKIDWLTYVQRFMALQVNVHTAQDPNSLTTTAQLKGRIINNGDRSVSSLVIAYENKFMNLNGSFRFGPIAAGGSLEVNEVLGTDLPWGVTDITLKVESLEF